MASSSSSSSFSSSSSSFPSSSCSSTMVGRFDFDDEKEKPHVLAVDDSLIDRKVIERLLINSACKVTTAENGTRALEFLGLADGQSPIHNGLKVNLIITDYCMPGMTGYELLKRIKESPNMKEVPVIVVSSENVPTRVKQCLEEGAHEFLLKPLQLSDVSKLRCHLNNSTIHPKECCV